MVKTKKTRIKRRATTRKKICGGNVSDPKIYMKIDELLILLTKKIKQDQNNKEFYTSCFESILKDIHNFKPSNTGFSGGRNLKLLITKLLILIMTLKTSLSSQMVVHDSQLSKFKKEIKDTQDVHDIVVVPKFKKYMFYSEPENVMNFKTSHHIETAVDSLNKHYITVISGKGSKLSSASKITNLCRDVFLGSDVQKILLSPKEEVPSIYTLYSTPTPIPTKTDEPDETEEIDFDTICELSFPIPRLFIDEQDQILKVEITKSISYKKIADMLETLYKGVNSDKLDNEVNIKISKLKYLIKGVRYIEESSRELTDFKSKIINVYERINDYFSTFEEIENMFGDPQLHFESVKKGLQNAFDTRLMDQQTYLNEIKVRSHMNSYILPFFSGVSSVSESSIEYFTNSVNSVISGFNIDKHLYNLIFIAMATLVSCVTVRTCLKKKNGSCVPNDTSMGMQQDIQRLITEQQVKYEKQVAKYAKQLAKQQSKISKQQTTNPTRQTQISIDDLQKLDEQLIKFAALKQEPRLRIS